LSRSLERAELAAVVPDDVRENFARVRKLHLYGLLDYDFFSIAIDQAHLVLEGALRHRFVSYYAGQVPVLEDGVARQLPVSSFADVYDALRRARKKKVRFELDEDGGALLPAGYADLFAWARRRRLLPGQRNANVFRALVKLRNYSAHPERHSVDMPPESVRLLRDVAEIINQLWGEATGGGRLYPTPVVRQARCAAVAPGGERASTLGSLGLLSEGSDLDWTYAVFLAADGEELVGPLPGPDGYAFTHRPGLQTTRYPCELLWGPGRRDDLLPHIAELATMTDNVSFLDRTFFVRVGADMEADVDQSRAAADVLTLDGDATELWFAVLADDPFAARAHVKNHGKRRGKLSTTTCQECQAAFVARFESRVEAQELATQLASEGRTD